MLRIPTSKKLVSVIAIAVMTMVGIWSATAQEQGAFWPQMTAEEQVVAPSPEMASLGGYADTAVDFASGQGSLSYSLLSWSVGGYPVQIGLSYRIGAFSTEEETGWIGLGWNLTGTGTVTRSIVGQPDELYGTEIHSDSWLESASSQQEAMTYLQNLSDNKADCMLDRYSYHLPNGISGSFVIVSGTIIQLPRSENEIIFTGATTDGVHDFTITTPDGTQYLFTEREHTQYRSIPATAIPNEYARSYTAVTTWHLSRIILPEGADVIEYTYQTMPRWTRNHNRRIYSITKTENTETGASWAYSSPSEGVNINETIIADRKIPYKIITRTGSATFSYTYPDSHTMAIASVSLCNYQGKEVKRAVFEGDGTNRRKLTSFTIESSDGTLLDQRQFLYHEDDIHTIGDLFGYPNRPQNDATLYASVIDPQTGRFNRRRKANFTYTTAGMLRSATSAMGVTTEYTYEPSTMPFGKTTRQRSVIIDDPLIPVDPIEETDTLLSIGVRIKSITATDRTTGVTRTRIFSYSDPICTVDFNRVSASDFVGISGQTSFHRSGLTLFADYSTTATMMEASKQPGAPIERARIYYSTVTELTTGTGIDHPIKSEYRFDTAGCTLEKRTAYRDYHHPYSTAIPTDYTTRDARTVVRAPAEGAGRDAFTIQRPTTGYLRESIGSEPRLSSLTTYEYRQGEYHPLTRQSYSYTTIDSATYTIGLHYESLVRRVKHVDTHMMSNDWQSIEDISHFNITLTAKRIITRRTTTERFFDDGSSRSSTTGYIYTIDNSTAQDEVIGTLKERITIDDVIQFPFIKVDISPFACDSISTSKSSCFLIGERTTACGFTMEHHKAIARQATKGFFHEANSRGLRTLTIREIWTLRDANISTSTTTQRDTILREYQYGQFASISGNASSSSNLITRPTAIITRIGNAEPMDVQRILGYTSHGRPLEVSQTDRPTMSYSWGYDGGLLISASIAPNISASAGSNSATLTTTFEHIPMVGCTKITTPSGKTQYYGYQGGRLSSISDTNRRQLSKYSYTICADAYPGDGQNRISASSMLTDAGFWSENRQYFNGFGAKVADVAIANGSSGEDIAVVTYMDALMRPVSQWMPLTLSENILSEALQQEQMLSSESSATYADAAGATHSSYPHSAETSPISTTVAGGEYSAHPSKTEITCSNPDDPQRAVARLSLSKDGKVTKMGVYGAGELDCVRSTDADGRTSLRFTDILGRAILSRVITEDGFADTYYISDSWGNPLVVLPPMAAEVLNSASASENIAIDDDILEQYCYIYRYDKQMRMIYKQTPQTEPVRYGYDSHSRMVMSRDGNQSQRGRRSFLLYDPLGRVAVTGSCRDALKESAWVGGADSETAHIDMTATRISAPIAEGAMAVQTADTPEALRMVGYSVSAEVASLLTDIEIDCVNYYDDYAWLPAGMQPGVVRDTFEDVELTVYNPAPKGLATGSFIAVRGDESENNSAINTSTASNRYALQYTLYDREERPVQSVELRHDGVAVNRTTAYTIGGLPTKTITEISKPAQEDESEADSAIKFKPIKYTITNSYDRHGRNIDSRLSIGNLDVSLGENIYDNLGRLSRVRLQGGAERVMQYDIHGWLRYWNCCGPASAFTVAQNLLYEDGAHPTYTGLISAKESLLIDRPAHYDYSYDCMGRLLKADYTDQLNDMADYSTDYTYDLHGNMLSLQRKGLLSTNSYGLIDDVTATYCGNQLMTLADVAPEVLIERSGDVAHGRFGEDCFDYDLNGNQTRDMSRGVTHISYNPINLPTVATFEGGHTLSWQYSADGRKLSETAVTRIGVTSQTTHRDYIGDCIYLDTCFDRLQLPQGYITIDDTSDRQGSDADPKYIYYAYIPDYQGNVLAVINTATNAVGQLNDYYPYGLTHTTSESVEYIYINGESGNRYKFGGKEYVTNHGWGAYDFSARWHTPAFPRFTTQDPKADSYHPLSPYLFCAANPVNVVDPSGMAIKLLGDESNVTKYLNILNRNTQDVAEFYVNDGFLNFKPINHDTEADRQSKFLLERFKKYIDDKETMELNLEWSTETLIGDVDKCAIDMQDIEALGEEGYANDIGALLHETDEQYWFQIERYDGTTSHFKALNTESKLQGVLIGPVNETKLIQDGHIDFQYQIGDGKFHILIPFDKETKNIIAK